MIIFTVQDNERRAFDFLLPDAMISSIERIS